MLLSRRFFGDKFLMHPTFPNLPDLLSEYILFKSLPRPAQTQKRLRVKLSCQIDEFLLDLSVKSDDIQPLL